MHWLRMDRYYAASPKKQDFFQTFDSDQKEQFQSWIDNPQVVTQPMICQHCESAPCENVCPVNPTVHDQEGLNWMDSNRFVGTGLCSTRGTRAPRLAPRVARPGQSCAETSKIRRAAFQS